MNQARIAVETERRTAFSQAYIAQFTLDEPADQLVQSDALCMIDMALTPRPRGARGQYSRHWKPDRYERLGKVWLAPPTEPVRFRSDPGVTRCIQCVLRPDAVSAWLGEYIDWNPKSLDKGLDLASDRIPALMERLACELSMPGFATDTMVELIMGQLVIEISRHLHLVEDCDDGNGLASWRRCAIDERLDADCDVPTLAELAALCGLSVRQLTRGYRASCGRSIGSAIKARRIENAQRLLSTDGALKAISYRLGFSSASAFTSAFRNATGETPGAYRTRLLGERRRVAGN